MHPRPTTRQRRHAFTRLDAAAIIAVLSLLALIAFPAITRNAFAATGITCVGNLGKMNLAWQLYSADNGGEIMNNLGSLSGTIADKTYLNWNHNLMDWTTNPSNTNRTLMATSKLYPYLENTTTPTPFKCPADRFISAQQSQAGWTAGRLRSYSMNGFMGAFATDTNDISYRGQNFLGANFRQFIMTSAIVRPEHTITFLDEHPDSINDGYFINVPNATQWYDLPGSHHNGAGGFSFADGRVEMHSWFSAATKQPVRYSFPALGPITSQRVDHAWLTERMTVLHQTLSVTTTASEAKIVWSPTTSPYILQSTPNLTNPDWTNVSETPARAPGQLNITTPASTDQRYFRLTR
jgi:hypothetical protein